MTGLKSALYLTPGRSTLIATPPQHSSGTWELEVRHERQGALETLERVLGVAGMEVTIQIQRTNKPPQGE